MRRWLRGFLLVLVASVFVVLSVVVGRAVVVEGPEKSVERVDVEVVAADRAVERLSQAVQYPTISPESPDETPESFVELREYLETEFPVFHEIAERQLAGDLTLHFTVEGTEPDAPHVVFLAHQDVVPVEEGTEDDWEHPPFSGAVADGFVWGRGTLDNKQNVMALLEAAETWFEEGGEPERTLHFVFGHDEEIGGLDGAATVAEGLESEGVDVETVYEEGLVITDGIIPGVDEPVALVGVTEKGYLTVEVTAEATGGHSSMPPRDLAVVRLARAIDKLEANPRPAAIDGPALAMFDRVAPEMDFLHRLLFRNLWLFEPLILGELVAVPSTNAAVRTTAAPTVLRAGDTENVLPQQAVATVNFRLHPRDGIDEVIAGLEELIGGEHITVEAVGEMRAEPSPVASMESPGFAAIEEAFAEVFGEIVLAPNVLVAATDSRHFTDLTDDIYRFTPVVLTDDDLERIHGTNERIGVEAYLDLIRYYSRLLRRW